MNPKTEFYFQNAEKWEKEVRQLRTIVLECGLDEAPKWGVACYMYHGKNVVLIHDFKEYFALLFPKGVLLADPEGLLIQQTENVQAARQMRLTSLKQVIELEATIKAYIYEAIEVERAGLKVDMKKTADFHVAEEFQQKLDESPQLKSAFESLTPGRQKGYLLYFSAAKQAKTREARVEKYIPQILNGKGLEDE